MLFKLIYVTSLQLCIDVTESKKPFGKRQQELWRLDCELGVITDSECPMDGGWSPWTSWSKCQGTCDYVGQRTRFRECNNPPTSKDGTPCSGPSEDIETCFIGNCSVEEFRKLIKGDLPRTEAMQQLEVVPALLERCLQMECPYEAVEAALSSENTWHLNSEILWNSLLCVKHNIGCPIRGEWGIWGSWSNCGARCGKGLRWRLRRCDTPPPSDATLICPGTPLISEECAGEQCVLEAHYTDYTGGGRWSEWGQWSSCSESCGSGVRRRKRTCLESHIPLNPFTWGTHCRGQHDQLEICINNRCSLDGSWSGWGPWGPCSQSCGAGKRSRTRSCTKPIPSGEGKHCEGLRTETGSCYLEPCEVYGHLVALFNGNSYLQYNLSNNKSTLFHFYIRFMPLSPSGTLVRRGSLQNPYVRLSLQKWHICLEASGTSQSCSLSHVCSSVALESAVWHTALIAVSSETVTIRIDNALIPIVSAFPCDPELENSAINIFVGERYNGEIQELKLNFDRLDIMAETDDNRKRSGYSPTFASNVAYEKSNMAEAFLLLENDHYVRLPCFEGQDEWRLELTVKSKRENGLILFLQNDRKDCFFYMTLQSMRVKVKLVTGEFGSESVSSTDYTPDQWLDITLSKKRGVNTIETTINAGDRLILTESTNKSRRKAVVITNRPMKRRIKKSKLISICNDEFFLGNIPVNVKNEILKEFTPFNGFIATLSINGVLLDLHNCSLERFKGNKITLSSRTASVSRTYHETIWGITNSLNLTCLHARNAETHNFAHWFLLDTSLSETRSDDRFVDDGKILRLIIQKNSDPKGFYSCRGHTKRNTYNVITYGIVGQVNCNLDSPDFTTLIAVLTTITLVVCTLSWLIVEGINDLRHGYGFFRDAHLSPQDEAEAICKYIDQNRHFYSSESAIKLAKTRARRKGRQLASRISFGAQEPQGLLQMQTEVPDIINESESGELETLPALPEVQSSRLQTSSDIHWCEPSYVNSPQRGTILSSDSKLSSPFEISPRALCSRLLLTKFEPMPEETIRSRKAKSTRGRSSHYDKSRLFTIKSSTRLNLSPAQKVLQKFNDLKSNDS